MIGFFKKNKKGNIQDFIFVIIFIIALIMVSVICYLIYDSINTKIQANPEISTEGKNAISTIHSNYPKWIDTAFLFVWLFAFLASLISAWFIDIHPVFFVFFIFVLIAVFLALIPISNFLETLFSNVELSTAVSHFPFMIFFITNYFKIAIASGFLIAILLFAKTRAME